MTFKELYRQTAKDRSIWRHTVVDGKVQLYAQSLDCSIHLMRIVLNDRTIPGPWVGLLEQSGRHSSFVDGTERMYWVHQIHNLVDPKTRRISGLIGDEIRLEENHLEQLILSSIGIDPKGDGNAKYP